MLNLYGFHVIYMTQDASKFWFIVLRQTTF